MRNLEIRLCIEVSPLPETCSFHFSQWRTNSRAASLCLPWDSFLKVEFESDESWAFFVPCNNSIQLIETYAILVRLQVAYETWGHLVDLAVCVETWPMGTWKGDNLASQSASPSQSLLIFLPNNLRRMPSETMQFYYSGSLWFYGFWDLELSSNTHKTDRKHLQVWHVSILPCVLSFPESCTWMVGGLSAIDR